MSENLPPVEDESFPNGEDLEKTKSKKKKKAIGAFAVEAEPGPKPSPKESDSKPETKPEPSEEKQPSAPEDLEKLDDIERAEVISQLAAARRQELDATPATDETTTAEIAAAQAYLAAAESEGRIDNSFSEELSNSPENQPTPNDSTDIIIETNQPAEGEIPIAHTPPPTVSRPIFNQRFEAPEVTSPVATVSPETTVPLAASLRRERKAQTDGLIVGGVVGYLLGRRRGRIKTEKRLAPIQKKLEKQVTALQTELVNREQSIRQLARSNSAVIETIKARTHEQLVKPRAERSPSLASAPEKIGHVLITGSNEQDNSAKKVVKTERLAARERAEQMDRNELLTLSQTIKVEGTSLRQIFETQLISEKGLRRLVAEHLRGGNLSRALRREIVERQIDFERDPILRDKHQSAGSEGAGKAALAAMLTRAGLPTAPESSPLGTPKKSSVKKDQTLARNSVQTAADIALLTLISVLSLVIFALLLRG